MSFKTLHALLASRMKRQLVSLSSGAKSDDPAERLEAFYKFLAESGIVLQCMSGESDNNKIYSPEEITYIRGTIITSDTCTHCEMGKRFIYIVMAEDVILLIDYHTGCILLDQYYAVYDFPPSEIEDLKILLNTSYKQFNLVTRLDLEQRND